MKERTRRKITSFSLVSMPFVWMMLFLFIPYLAMFTYSFYIKQYPLFIPAFEFVNYITLVSDPQYYQVLLRTARIALMVAGAALLIAYPMAYFLVFKIRSDKLRAALYMAVIVPLWVSYLLRAYTWKTILGSEGILNSFLVWSGILDQPTDIFLYNQFSMVVTLTYIYVPFMVMPIYMASESAPAR